MDNLVPDFLGHAIDKLHISTLSKAAKISPYIKEVTIGPSSQVVNTNKKPVIKKICENKNKVGDKVHTAESIDNLYYAREREDKWRSNADCLFKKLLGKMVDKRKEIMTNFWQKQAEDYERRALEVRDKEVQILREWKSAEEFVELENENEQKYYSDSKAIEYMKDILEEQNKAAKRFAALTESQATICTIYKDITDLLSDNSNDIAEPVLARYQSQLTSIISEINNLMELCKGGIISENEVKSAETLQTQILNLKTSICTDLMAKAKEMELQQQILEEESKKKLEAQKNIEEEKLQKKQLKKAQIQVEQTAIETLSQPTFFSSYSIEIYKELINFLEAYETLYAELLNNATLKKFRFECQKAVNTPVNALSSLSGTHIRDKFNKLHKLLKGERVPVNDVFVSAAQHPQGIAYCTSLLAKKIVRQGDLLISSNPEAAFPLASVAIALWSHFPDLGKLIHAYILRDCPYLVPMFLPQSEGQSDQDFYKSRGYTYGEDGAVEKQDKFLKRMSGIFRLSCAMWITKPSTVMTDPNPHGLDQAWRWLAAFVNLKPEPDICATLLFEFLTVCGSECFRAYGKQFLKVLQLINTEYFRILQKIDEGGPKTRLEVFLQNIISSGHISPPKGILPEGTW